MAVENNTIQRAAYPIDRDKPVGKKIPEKGITNNGTEVQAEIDFDVLLSSAGEFGCYQILLLCCTFPFYLIGCYIYFTQLFMTEVSPHHWCWIPELENLTVDERRNLAIPLEEDSRFGFSQCKAFVANWTEVLETVLKPDRNWTTAPCQNGWEFDQSEIPYPTISSEMGWVCERDSYQATAQAVFFLGSITGGSIIGWITDRYGRLKGIVVSNAIGFIGSVLSVFAGNFVEFALCRFFTGISYDNSMMIMYLLILEYVAPKYRTFMANASFAVFYSLAVTTLPWIALACGNWKTLCLVTSIPMGLAIFSPLFVPESPRWLLSRGRVDDAVKKLLTIGRINRKEVPPKLIEQFKTSVENAKKEERGSMIDLMRRSKLRNMFIYASIVYISSAIIFDGLVRSIGQLQFDFFVSFSLVSATEFPSMMLNAFIMDWSGRRWLTCSTLFASGVFCLLMAFVSVGLLSVIFAVAARFFVNIGYGTIMQWSAEVLPTPVRGSGSSIVHIFSFIGTMIAPYIVYLGTYVKWLPQVIMSMTAVIGGIAALMLPETANKEMPQTFDDAEEMMRTQKFWEAPTFMRNEDRK